MGKRTEYIYERITGRAWMSTIRQIDGPARRWPQLNWLSDAELFKLHDLGWTLEEIAEFALRVEDRRRLRQAAERSRKLALERFERDARRNARYAVSVPPPRNRRASPRPAGF